MDLRTLQENWDELGRRDALGVILSYPLRLNDWELDEFLATGEREIAQVLEEGKRFGLPRAHEAALDFGCGVGRLTQAMCSHFERADGVDIAPSMIEAAERLNRHGDRCRYHLNESDTLAFPDASFDFVYSNITLQHIEPAYARRYIAELARVLRPGGLLVFQVPSERERLPKLPRNAVLAEIEPLVGELVLEAGARADVRVRVRNAGAAAWPARPGDGVVNLGNHWRSAGGELLQLDDGREQLPHDVAPGEEAELTLRVTAPAEPGEYVLELDLVQEGYAWFAQRRKLSRRRTRPARVRVRVTEARERDGEPAAREEARMEMHAVPRREVLEILPAGGARAVEIVENDAAGPGWVSLRYTATKDR